MFSKNIVYHILKWIAAHKRRAKLINKQINNDTKLLVYHLSLTTNFPRFKTFNVIFFWNKFYSQRLTIVVKSSEILYWFIYWINYTLYNIIFEILQYNIIWMVTFQDSDDKCKFGSFFLKKYLNEFYYYFLTMTWITLVYIYLVFYGLVIYLQWLVANEWDGQYIRKKFHFIFDGNDHQSFSKPSKICSCMVFWRDAQ